MTVRRWRICWACLWKRSNDARLYRGLDALLPHKDALCAHLLAQYRDWFGVRNVRIENCAFVRGGQNGIFIKSRDGRGSFIENVTGENLTFGPRCGTFLGIDLMTKGIQAAEPVPGDIEKWTLARNISFKNIKVDGVPTLIAGRNISAARPFDGLSLSNITGTCQRGITLANVVNADFKDINVTGYNGSLLSLTNVTGKGLEIKN